MCKELVARGPVEVQVALHRDREAVDRVHSHSRGPGECKTAAIVHTDLQVSPRGQQGVHPLQEFVSAGHGVLRSGSGATLPWDAKVALSNLPDRGREGLGAVQDDQDRAG